MVSVSSVCSHTTYKACTHTANERWGQPAVLCFKCSESGLPAAGNAGSSTAVPLWALKEPPPGGRCIEVMPMQALHGSSEAGVQQLALRARSCKHGRT